MSELNANGRLTVKLGDRTATGEWQVVEGRVEVHSSIGTHSLPLGPLKHAPATVAREMLVELLKRAQRADRPRVDRARFNVRDA